MESQHLVRAVRHVDIRNGQNVLANRQMATEEVGRLNAERAAALLMLHAFATKFPASSTEASGISAFLPLGEQTVGANDKKVSFYAQLDIYALPNGGYNDKPTIRYYRLDGKGGIRGKDNAGNALRFDSVGSPPLKEVVPPHLDESVTDPELIQTYEWGLKSVGETIGMLILQHPGMQRATGVYHTGPTLPAVIEQDNTST